MSQQVDYEEALKKLDELQARSQRLRFDLPNILRGLAHIDERQAPNTIFTKVVQDIHSMGGEIDEFNEMYRQNEPILNFGRKEKSAVLQQSNPTPGATTTPSSNNPMANNMSKNTTTNNSMPSNMPNNVANMANIANMPNNSMNRTMAGNNNMASPQSIISRMGNGNTSMPPTTRDSTMAGMSQDQPIVLDDSGMNFVQF